MLKDTKKTFLKQKKRLGLKSQDEMVNHLLSLLKSPESKIASLYRDMHPHIRAALDDTKQSEELILHLQVITLRALMDYKNLQYALKELKKVREDFPVIPEYMED
jgi:Mg2+ and Co2+ transporter CorA